MLDGHYLDPKDATGVLAEKHIAGHANLAVGSAVRVWQDGAWRRLGVRGVAASPEYLWPAASR